MPPPRADRLQRGGLGLEHQLVDLARLDVDIACGECPGAIRAVAVDDRPHVEHHQLAGTDLALARLRVRERAVLARGDDRRERRALGAQLAHPLLCRERDIALFAPHEPLPGHPLVHLVGEPLRLGDRGELVELLRAAQLLDESRGRNELDALRGDLLELAQVAHAGVRVVVPHPPREALGERGQELTLRGGALELGADLTVRALRVAEVREEDSGLVAASHPLPHQAQPAGPGEPGQISQVGHSSAIGVARAHQVADEELVELALAGQSREAPGAAHVFSLPLRISSARRYPSGPSPETTSITSPSSTDDLRHSSRESTFERWTSTAGTAAISTASRIA